MTETMKLTIPFTQYLRPNGDKVRTNSGEVSPYIYDKAMQIINAGYTFEAEVLNTGMVSMTISDGEEDVAGVLVQNGPHVPKALDTLVINFDLMLQVANDNEELDTEDAA